MRRIAILTACLALAASPVLAQSISLEGPDGQRAEATATMLAALPQAKVTFDAHGETHVYEGPLLIDVLAAVGAPTGKALHGPELADAVVVSAADGYQVAFGLAEADPATRPNRMILATRADGAALDAANGPFKLVVEGDLRPARGVRMVTSIAVRRLGAPMTEASAHHH